MKKFSLMVFCFAALLYVSFVSSDSKTVTSNSRENASDDVQKYLENFYAKDFQALQGFYNERSVFKAPAGLWNGASDELQAEGKEQVLTLLKEKLKPLPETSFLIHEHFKSGEYTVVHGHMQFAKEIFSAGGSSQRVGQNIPVTVILKIKDGKVLMHEEFKGKTEFED